ncbi:TonB-dependent receptor [Sphingomonas rosea]|uniref:TonB-dependent receptor n=1 Tax=Sphingomonas rosea TaxID=335605 RepID=A0ABP7TX69_9SPHN
MKVTDFRSKLLTTSAVLAGSLLISTQAFAQTAPAPAPEPGVAPKENSEAVDKAKAEQATDATPEQELVVTGTRITNPNLVQSSPVQVIGEGEIQLQQVTSAEELLHDLPGQVPSLNQNVNNGGSGAAFINLRGLGSNRNLVLLDGQRIVPVDLVARTDLNQIPLALIERVDVFTGGASTVYGADAVSGVVNFVTKRNFSGVDLDLGSGISERGDGRFIRGALTFGTNFADNRGNVVLSSGYTDTKPIYYDYRDYSRVATSSATGLPQGSDTAVPLSIRNGGAAFTQLNTTTGLLGPRASTYNTNPLNLLQTPLTRYNVFGKARYEFSDKLEVYMTGMWTKSKVVFNAAPTGIFGNNVFVPVSNGYLAQNIPLRNQLCGLVDSNPNVNGVQTLTQAECDAAAAATSPTSAAYRELLLTADRRFVEDGPRVTTYNFNTFQFTGGARGPLTSTLNWDVWVGYGESNRTTSATSGLLANVQQALRATNTTTCTVTTNSCVPLNIFGPQGSITQAQLAFIKATTYNFVDTNLTQAQASISGDLGFALPWATQPVGISAGLEYRKYFGFSRGDAISAVPGAVLGAGAAALPQQGTYYTKEAYAEAIVPLIENRPFFNNLTLEFGGRVADYNLTGKNYTYKIGGSWSPVRDLKIRAMYTRAARAANLSELYQPQVVALSNLTTDPCQGQITNAAGTNYNATLAGSTALQQLCVATGVPQSIIGTGAIPAPSSGQIQTTQGGNPLLEPEIAKTFTVGAVLQPRFVPNFALTVDYYNIDVERAITNPTVNDIISGCYGAGNPNFSATNLFCTLVKRNTATGRLDGEATTTPGLQLALSNQGFLQTRGVDVTANYRQDLGSFGRLSFAFQGNRTFRSTFKAIPSPLSPLRECTGFYSASCQPIQPKISWSLRTTLSWLNGLDTSLNWRHISKARIEPRTCINDPALSCGPLASTIFDAYERIPAYDYFDLSNRFQATDHMTFTFTVQNLLDKQPPFVGNTVGATAFNGGNTFPSNYDVVGRNYRVGVNLKF